MGETIRVLHILHSMNRGGAETMLMNYYRHINRERIQFDFLLTVEGKSDYEEEILSLGGRLYHITPLTRATIKQYLDDIARFFKEHPDYTMVHSHTSSKSVLPLWVAKKHGISVRISHSHNMFLGKSVFNWKETMRKLLRMPLKWCATDYFACSEGAAVWLYGQREVQRGRVHILNNAIDSKAFSFDETIRRSYREKFKLQKQFVVGHVGRFQEQKNHTFLLAIYQEIYKKNPNSALLLVGDGEQREEIEKKVRQLGLQEQVIFTGVREDISALLQMMDVFVFPSRFEGLGMVLIEAQAAGLPSFTSKTVVPLEAKVSNLLEYISLEETPEYWAEQIVKQGSTYERRNTEIELERSGYDIQENAKWLEHFYLERNLSVKGLLR